MNVQKNVPEIRFKGFSGEWIKEKIANIAPLQRGFDLPKNEMKAGEYPVVMSNGVNGFHNIFKSKAPGVVTGRSGTIGNIHYVDVDYWPHNTALWVTNFHGNEPRFVYYLYVKLDLKRFGTGSGVPTLNRNDVHDQSVVLPKESEEQTAIGNTFQKLDSLINQHQQKHDKLSNIKKAMLEKMFPKQGETIPEIRFKGFSGEWEEVSLSDFGVATSGTSIESEFTKDGKYKVISIGSYSENSVYTEQGIRASLSPKTESRVLEKNDLTMILNDKTLAGNIIGRVLLIDEDDSYVYNQRTQRIEPSSEYAPQFLYQFLNAPSVRKRIFKASQGNTQIYVNWSAISKLKYFIPKKDEQIVIGNYFHKLDDLITQHQQQITKLTNIKQACLSKMFV